MEIILNVSKITTYGNGGGNKVKLINSNQNENEVTLILVNSDVYFGKYKVTLEKIK